MTCKETVAILGDVLDRALSPATGRALEAHLRDGKACAAYLRTYRMTIHLAARTGRVTMPPELDRRLRRFLPARLAVHHSVRIRRARRHHAVRRAAVDAFVTRADPSSGTLSEP